MSNGSAGAAEKSSLRWDNVNNNNNISNNNNTIFGGSSHSNVQAGSSASFSLHNTSQPTNTSNNLGIYSGASSLSGDNMSIGSITDIPGISYTLTYQHLNYFMI